MLRWELITGSQPPIPEGSVDELKVALLMQRLKLPLPKALPTKMKTLITLCWSHDERKRPNMSTVLSMLDEAVVAVLLPDPCYLPALLFFHFHCFVLNSYFVYS